MRQWTSRRVRVLRHAGTIQYATPAEPSWKSTPFSDTRPIRESLARSTNAQFNYAASAHPPSAGDRLPRLVYRIGAPHMQASNLWIKKRPRPTETLFLRDRRVILACRKPVCTATLVLLILALCASSFTHQRSRSLSRIGIGSLVRQDCVEGVLRCGVPILRTSCSDIAL